MKLSTRITISLGFTQECLDIQTFLFRLERREYHIKLHRNDSLPLIARRGGQAIACGWGWVPYEYYISKIISLHIWNHKWKHKNYSYGESTYLTKDFQWAFSLYKQRGIMNWSCNSAIFSIWMWDSIIWKINIEVSLRPLGKSASSRIQQLLLVKVCWCSINVDQIIWSPGQSIVCLPRDSCFRSLYRLVAWNRKYCDIKKHYYHSRTIIQIAGQYLFVKRQNGRSINMKFI